jgi:hypothetical protein
MAKAFVRLKPTPIVLTVTVFSESQATTGGAAAKAESPESPAASYQTTPSYIFRARMLNSAGVKGSNRQLPWATCDGSNPTKQGHEPSCDQGCFRNVSPAGFRTYDLPVRNSIQGSARVAAFLPASRGKCPKSQRSQGIASVLLALRRCAPLRCTRASCTYRTRYSAVTRAPISLHG